MMLAVPCGLAGLYEWLVFAFSFRHDGLIGPRYNAPGADYMVYWLAAREALAGSYALLADPVAMTGRINAAFHDWLSSAVPLHPWLYPPHFLLLLLPFGAFPFAASYALFQLATGGALLAAFACWVGPVRRSWPWLMALVLAPAAAINAVSGQNAFLTAALLLGGIGLLGRADRAGGALLGLLTVKPQFAVLVPVALVAGRHWRALAAAAASAGAAVLLSAIVFGALRWQDWVTGALGRGDSDWQEWGRLWGVSVWTCARLLGASAPAADAAQAVAALLAAGSVWIAFRRPLAPKRRVAVLLAATLLAAPHCSQYDLLLLEAAVLLILSLMREGVGPAVPPALLFLPWAAPVLTVPRANPVGFLIPLLMLGVMLLAMLPAPGRAAPPS